MLTLTANRIALALGAGLALLVLSACTTTIESIPRLEEFRSATQTLRVTNRLESAVHLVAADPTKPVHTLEPGEKIEIEFFVITVTELERADDGPWYRRRAGTEQTELRAVGDPAYLEQIGEDVHLQVTGVEDGPWTFLYSLGECWNEPAQSTAVQGMAIRTEPLAGIPATLCP
jgi:hypothetical protein